MKYRPHGLLALGMLLAISPAAALAQTKSKTPTQQPKPPAVTANNSVAAISKAYQNEQSAFFQGAPKGEAAQRKYFEKYGDIPKRYLPIFKQVAAKRKGTEEGAEALLWILQLAPAANDTASIKSALTQLDDDAYFALPTMERAAAQMQSLYLPDGTAKRDEFLTKLIAKSPHKKVKAAAMYTLAAATISSRGGTMTRDGSVVGNTTREDALKMLRDLKDNYADTRYGKQAEGFIFEAEKLQIGMVAPDIEGEDEKGVKFRLAEYQGKVVVLDFWGFW